MIDKSDRYDFIGVLKYMAHCKTHVMVRRPRAIPFVVKMKDWESAPKFKDEKS